MNSTKPPDAPANENNKFKINEQNKSKIRTKPDGLFHIGSARTALFNWLYARHTGGTFVLRIEDTDKERNGEEYLNVLKDGMKWLGLDWDEGPDVGGNYGPYFQSKRDDIYKNFLEILRKKAGHTTRTARSFSKFPGRNRCCTTPFTATSSA